MSEPKTDTSRRVAITACSASDILDTLVYCRGCFEPIPRVVDANGDDPTILARRDAHEAMCVAYAGFVVSEKLARQARDDGRDDDADEIMEPYLI